MCQACWLEFGAPAIDTPAVRAAARAVASVYGFGRMGGNLHSVVDDWNIADGYLDSPGRFIAENLFEASEAELAAERRCLALLRGLTEDERASALALHEGFWEPAHHS